MNFLTIFLQKYPFLHRILHILKIVFFFFGGFLVLVYIVFFVFRNFLYASIIFLATHVNTLEYSSPLSENISLEFEDIHIPLENGDIINGLYIENASETTVYYFHGNGGDLRYFYPVLSYISSLGYNVMAYDYPGYGLSTGFPYKDSVSQFSETFFQYISQEKGVTLQNTIVWGYSVGTGVSIDFAQGKPIQALLLFSPFRSLFDMSQDQFGFVLQKIFFLPDWYPSFENIQNISAPVLFVHGTQDQVVPFSQGKQLYQELESGQKFFVEIQNATHYDTLDTLGARPIVEDFLSDFRVSEPYIKIDTVFKQQFLENAQILDLDMISDTSLHKFVNPDVSFQKKSYIPENLEFLERDFIIDTKGNAQLRDIAKGEFEKMAQDFYEEFDEKIVVVSSYRSYNYQAGIKARGCPDNLCAKAGHSEHQSGLAIDLWSASTQATWQNSPRLTRFYTWLSENAHLYGFHNTYQRGLEIDGYEIEPWHWRYVGKKLATHLKENDITLAEFYYQHTS